MRKLVAIVVILVVGVTSRPFLTRVSAAPTDHPAAQDIQLELTGSFNTRSPWTFVVTEGTPTKDYGDNDAPGALTLCLRKGPTGPCVSDPVTPPLLKPDVDGAPAWEPHYLKTAEVVYPRGAKAMPLLLIVTGSLNSGDGDQIVATQLVAYDSDKDAFRRVYAKSTGRNNNQEIRFVADGPLRGDVISAEPQKHSPFGYWITVDQPNPMGLYKQALRYGSATRYNNGNPLSVIDAEMPNIQKRLGLWKSGDPIPTPAIGVGGKPCLKPVLRKTELWCN